MREARGTRGLLAAIVLSLVSGALGAHELSSTGPIGFDEKLGGEADLTATFTGEDGAEVPLASLSGKPLILELAYYRCKDQCNTLTLGVAKALRGMGGRPGIDWQLVTVSINPAETPADAAKEKRIALDTVGTGIDPGAWRFLVGGDDAIDRLADSVGFSYRQVGQDYDHPLGVVLVSATGKITRYVMGPDFLPVDLSMGVMEASKGIVGPTVAKALRFCMSYDPARRQYGLDILRVSGIATTIVVLIFAIVLVVSGARRRAAATAAGRVGDVPAGPAVSATPLPGTARRKETEGAPAGTADGREGSE